MQYNTTSVTAASSRLVTCSLHILHSASPITTGPVAQHNTIQHNTAQYNTEQCITEQYKTEQRHTEQCNTEQRNAEQCNTEQCNADQSNTEQRNTEQSNTEQSNTEQCNTEQSNTEQGNTEQSNTEQRNTEQSNTEQCNTTSIIAASRSFSDRFRTDNTQRFIKYHRTRCTIQCNTLFFFFKQYNTTQRLSQQPPLQDGQYIVFYQTPQGPLRSTMQYNTKHNTLECNTAQYNMIHTLTLSRFFGIGDIGTV